MKASEQIEGLIAVLDLMGQYGRLPVQPGSIAMIGVHLRLILDGVRSLEREASGSSASAVVIRFPGERTRGRGDGSRR